MIAVAVLLAPAAASVAGLYQSHQMEVGAALELKADGTFRYQLDYGAVSEQAAGRWKSDGKTVRLTTAPKPKAPDFEVVKDEPAPNGEIILLLAEPYQGWNGPITGYAVPRSFREPLDLDVDEQGRSGLDSAGVKAIIPKIPVYGGLGSQIPISPERGHRLLLRFRANDLGIAAFDAERLAITPRGLVLNRYETEIRFIRVRP